MPRIQLRKPGISRRGLVLDLPLYKLDGSSFMDRSAYGHLATVTGAIWRPDGRGFEGDDYVELTSTQMNYTTGAFSIWAWVKVTSLADNRVILIRGLSLADGYFLYIGSGGEIIFYTYQASASQVSYSAAGTITTGNWNLIGVTRSGSSARVFKNVVDVTNTVGTHTNPLTNVVRTVKIGIYDDKVSSPMVGIIREVGSVNRVLSQGEWQRLYLATKRYQ